MLRKSDPCGHMKIGDAAVNSPYSSSLYGGDVDGDFGVFASAACTASPPLKQRGGRLGGPDTDRLWHDAGERLGEWSRSLRDRVTTVLVRFPTVEETVDNVGRLGHAVRVAVSQRIPTPADLGRLRERADSGSRDAAERMREAGATARGQLLRWNAAVNHLVRTRRQTWLLVLEERWRDVRLHWMIYQSVLLERLAALGRELRPLGRTLLGYWRRLCAALRACCSWLLRVLLSGCRRVLPKSVLALCRPATGCCVLLDDRYVVGRMGLSVRAFALCRRGELMRACQGFCQGDKDCRIVDDFLFVFTEPQMKCLVAALLVALFVVGEMVAVSYLPVLCPSASVVDCGMDTMMTSATLSPSVLASLTGSAGMF